jgi:WD40-like Beta Propeller Repeat
VTPVTHLEPQETGHRFPEVLPTGRHVLYYATGAPERSGVFVARLDGSERRRLFPSESAATYASGHLLFARQGALNATRFNSSTLTTSGTPAFVADHVAVDTSLGRPAVSGSASGVVLYRRHTTGTRLQFIWFDRQGGEMGRPRDAGPAHPDFAAQGDRVAMTRTDGGNPDVWIVDLESGRSSRFSLQPSTEIYPVWSPDGRQILLGSNRRGRGGLELYLQSMTTSDGGALIPNVDGLTTVMPDDWSPDGRFIIFRGLNAMKATFDLWAMRLDDRRKPFVLAETDFEERDAQFSPDGKWIAYHSDESGRFDVYVAPFMRPGARTLVSTGGGAQVRWRGDGRELF